MLNPPTSNVNVFNRPSLQSTSPLNTGNGILPLAGTVYGTYSVEYVEHDD